MKGRGVVIILMLWSVFAAAESGKYRLRWHDQAGISYKSNTFFRRHVYRNDKLQARDDGRNKNIINVRKVKGDTAFLLGKYHLYEKPSKAQTYRLLKIERVRFTRTERGREKVSRRNLYPIVRNAFQFPREKLSVGDQWRFTAQESQVLMKYDRGRPRNWPLKFTCKVAKAFMKENRPFLRIDFEYTADVQFKKKPLPTYPVRLKSHVRGYYHWDLTAHFPPYYRAQGVYVIVFRAGSHHIKNKTIFPVIETHTEKKVPLSEEEKETTSKELSETFKKKDIDVGVRPSREGVIIDLPNILFDKNSARLKVQARETLKKIIPSLNKSTRDLRIGGHTDDSGSDAYNQKLSKRRAAAVAEFLIRHGVDSKKLSYKGYGDSQPRVPNNSLGNRQKNRRVEIIILNE
jgi:outer membrane protein OmpA-like peptidoglycan-associated protein